MQEGKGIYLIIIEFIVSIFILFIPHISQNFVVRAWRALLRGRELVKRRSSRIDILQSGVLSIRAVTVGLSALAAGIL